MSQSTLGWMFSALGPLYLALLVLVGLASFVCAIVLVFRGRGPLASAALVLIVPGPLLVGLFAAVDGALRTLQVLGMSDTTPRAADLAEGAALALVGVFLGALLTAPGYLVASGGALVRSLLASDPPRDGAAK